MKRFKLSQREDDHPVKPTKPPEEEPEENNEED
jgi:hypothetical protein